MLDTEDVVRSFRAGLDARRREPDLARLRVRQPGTGGRAATRRVVEAGFHGEQEPWDAFWGQRYAQLSDPDGVAGRSLRRVLIRHALRRRAARARRPRRCARGRRSADELIDEEAFDEDEFLPYWAELWPSGVALAERVAELDLRGARVLELGAGLGLPSLAAALGGADVLATDWAEDAVELLRPTRRGTASRCASSTCAGTTPSVSRGAPWDARARRRPPLRAAERRPAARAAAAASAGSPARRAGTAVRAGVPRAQLGRSSELGRAASTGSGYGERVLALALAAVRSSRRRGRTSSGSRSRSARSGCRDGAVRTAALRHRTRTSCSRSAIVEHFTATSSFSSAYNTFAADVPDAELHQLPGTCAHFIIDRDGTIYQLVPLDVMCRHTVGLNWVADRDRARRHYRTRRCSATRRRCARRSR